MMERTPKTELVTLATDRPVRKLQYGSMAGAIATLATPLIMWIVPEGTIISDGFEAALATMLTFLFSLGGTLWVGYRTYARRGDTVTTDEPLPPASFRQG